MALSGSVQAVAGVIGERSGTDAGECPFCERVEKDDVALGPDRTAVAFPDQHPVAEGHLLIGPSRHLSRLEDLEVAEWLDLFALARELMRELAARPDVDGVNLGVNSGVAAGQTVEHAHLHLIPRRVGDVHDPRGGVRHVIPSRAEYWSPRD